MPRLDSSRNRGSGDKVERQPLRCGEKAAVTITRRRRHKHALYAYRDIGGAWLACISHDDFGEIASDRAMPICLSVGRAERFIVITV